MENNFKKLIYLANAYSSHKKDPDAASLERTCRRHLESYVGGVLRKRHDVAFILPIANSGAMSDICEFGTGFDEWVRDDLTFISRVDEVWVLTSDGWLDSKGVQAEINFAKAIGKPVRYIHPQTLDISDDIEL